jgi:hypothetical protein
MLTYTEFRKKITIKGSSELLAGVTDLLPYVLMPPTYCLPIGFNSNFQPQLKYHYPFAIGILGQAHHYWPSYSSQMSCILKPAILIMAQSDGRWVFWSLLDAESIFFHKIKMPDGPER